MNIRESLEELITLRNEVTEVLRENDEPLEELDMDSIKETALERHQEGVLEVSKKTVYEVLLGCGGPTEYVSLVKDENGDFVSGSYTYTGVKDGPQTVELSDDEVDLFVSRYALGDI